MRFSKVKNDDTILCIDEHETTASQMSSSSSVSSPPHRKQRSSIQCHTLRQDHMPCSIDKPSPSAEYIYTEIVKAVGNDEFIAEKRLLKRASWSPAVLQEHGLPPTGKRTDNEQIPTLRNANRVRLRPKVARYYQPSQQQQQQHPPSSYPHQISNSRPVSFNERYDRLLLEYQQRKLSSASTNRTSSFSFQRREPSRSPSSSSVDTIVQITTHASPSIDNSDFISDTSAASSVTTTTNTITSLASTIPSQLSRRTSPSFERIYSPTKRPLSSDYQQHKQNSTHIDYKSSSPAPQTNNISSSSPISFFSPRSTSITTTTSSSSTMTYTCPKGHEQPLSSPTSSSVNQYTELTLQTLNADTTRDDSSSPLPSSTRTTRTVMTMSVSPNRHHHRTHSAKAIITSAQMSSSANVTFTPNNSDGLKQQQEQDQTESTIVSNNGCLKSPTNTNSNNRIKKSVHFDWHIPKEIRSTTSSPVKINSSNNYRPSVTIASSSSSSSSSSLSNGNSKNDIDEQKKLFDDQHHVETLKEKEKFETARTTISPNPLTTTTNTILRSFSLSPSPLSKEEKYDSRRQRGEEEEEEEKKKKENVDEPYCTTSRRVTTAATHLHCTTNTATVTFNDGTNNVSQKKESNTTNNSNIHLLKRPSPSSVDQSMPSNSLLVKTSSLNTIIYPPNPPATSSTAATAKKLISNGLLSLIGRSNSNNSKSSTSTEESKQLRRTSSTQLRAQRKTKQQSTLTTGTNGSQRLSADVESFFPPSSSINNNHSKISNEDTSIFDKVTPNQNLDRQQSLISLVSTSTDKNINATSSINTDSTNLLCTNMTNIQNNSISMSTNSTTTMIQSNAEDSLNNGLLFQPVTDPKCDYVLHNHQATTIKEPFFLSPPKSLSNRDESTMMQTSTLIISTPPQYHYYLYPPINNSNALSSSSSTTSSSASLTSTSKKTHSKIISTTNRTISNVSINSVSTNSSSSYPSCESQTHDTDFAQSSQVPIHAEDETQSSSTYSISNYKARQKKVVQSALIDWKTKASSPNTDSQQDSTSKTKPVILSDSVQAFWPPPPSPSTLDIQDSGLPKLMTFNTEQTKQSESKSTSINNHMISTNSPNRHHMDNEEMISYSEQHLFTNGCLRNAGNTSLEDTPASYTERLREKSRSIPMNGTNDRQNYLTRSISKDALNNSHSKLNSSQLNINDTNESLLRPKSSGQQMKIERTIPSNSNLTANSENNFQSKREFFENRIYTDHTSSSSNTSLTSIQTNILPTKPKQYTLSPSNSPKTNLNYSSQTPMNNHSQRNMTRRSWNDLSSQQTSTSESNQFPPPPPPTIKKPVRIIKVVQQSPSVPPSSSFSINEFNSFNRPLPTSKTYLLAKPGLFSASPINSSQKLPIKTSNSPHRDETDLQTYLKDFILRFPQHHLINDLSRLIISNEHHLSTDYTRTLFPIPDRLRRIRSRHSSDGDTNSLTTSSNSSSDYIHRTVSNDSCIYDDDVYRQVEDFINSLKKRLDNLKENQRTINDESEDNKILGLKLLNIIESNGESNEIEKFKLHINEIDTITSILLKLSSRLAKIENDLLILPENSDQIKKNLFERREKAQQKYDEAKTLKDGIDRRSRVVTTILRKYFSNEQYDDYEHFIRMKSTLLMDAKDIEENISIIEKQIEILNHFLLTDYSTSNKNENFNGNSLKILSSTA